MVKKLKKLWKQCHERCRKKYRLVRYTNPLTAEDSLFYIEETFFIFWWRNVRIKKAEYQTIFGCDKDGMYGKLENAERVLSFLRGDIKVTRDVLTK
jgi:hypothetical protein